MNKPYRTISYPSCPYCKSELKHGMNDKYYGKLVNMATGSGSSDVVVTCENCGKKYRVTVLIKFNARKLVEEQTGEIHEAN